MVSIRRLYFWPQNAFRSQNLPRCLRQEGKEQHLAADTASRERDGLEFLEKKGLIWEGKAN